MDAPNKEKRREDAGYVLLTTILLLALVTAVVFSALRTSAVELQICTNELLYKKYFYLAEAGIAHGVEVLEPLLAAENEPAARGGLQPAWNFAFQGPDRAAGTADDARGRIRQPGGCEQGSVWLDVRRPDGSWYRVTVWNNDEPGQEGDYDTDRDGLIWLRSDAGGPRGGRVSIQVLLQAAAEGQSAGGYPAQAAGGAAGNNSGVDSLPIVEFEVQMEPGAIE